MSRHATELAGRAMLASGAWANTWASLSGVGEAGLTRCIGIAAETGPSCGRMGIACAARRAGIWALRPPLPLLLLAPCRIDVLGLHTAAGSRQQVQPPLSSPSSPPPPPGIPEADRLWNLPNSLSIARGVSGPFIALLIVQEQWPAALLAVTVSGVSPAAVHRASPCSHSSLHGSADDGLLA